MEEPQVASDRDLLDTAFDVVRRFRDFDSYGSGAKASRALQRRCPDFSVEQYAEAFQQAEQLYDAAKEVVEQNKELLLTNWDHLHNINHTGMNQEMQARCPMFRESTRNSALGWIFTWHHLR